MSDRARALESIERLIHDQPKLSFVSESDAALGEEYRKKYGLQIAAGRISYAVHPEILRLFPEYVGANSLTLETGSGHTTIALAALSKHHICISPDKTGVQLVTQYMDTVGIPRDQVTFIEESSELALPALSLDGKLDFGYVDGCHGYPFPALDWHFIDWHLKVGGHIAFDNVEVPSVRYHCDFLDENRSYSLVKKLVFRSWGDYQVNVYRKEKDEPREWIFQAFNEERMPKPRRPPGLVERTMARVLPWRLIQVPLRKRFGWPRAD
jgi:predicted O-methyltransferase YrrM